MKRKILPTVLALGIGVAAARGQTADSESTSTAASIVELQSQIKSMEAKVQALQLKQQRQAAEQQVLLDADQQGELISTYDPNVGFVIRSADGAFSFHPGLVLDFRDLTSYRENLPAGEGGESAKVGDHLQTGFNLTRARLTLDGNFTRDINYFVQLYADDGVGTVSLLDAYWTYHFGSGSPLALKVGQFKDPLWHERNLSEANLLAVDRSLVEALLGGGQTSRVQGAALLYDQDRLRGQVVFHDGYDSLNTKFFQGGGGIGAGITGGSGVTPTDFGTTGRVEYLVLGDRTAKFNPFTEYDGGFTALGDKQDILVVGGGLDYSQAGNNDILFHTADLQFDTAGGLSLYGAYLGTYRDIHELQGAIARTATTPAKDVPIGNYYDPGFVVQAAYLVTPRIEPFARYDYTYLQGGSSVGFGVGKNPALADNTAQEVTVGANYYLYKQHAKITVDGSWLPDGSPTDEDALGILQDSGHEEFVLRVQFQLAI